MSSRGKKTLGIGAVVLLIGCAHLVLVQMTDYGIPCLFRLVTGLKCPGCGVTHMILDLLRLRFRAAFYDNAALFCLSPALAALLGVKLFRFLSSGTLQGSKAENLSAWTIVALLLIWGAVRNVIGL